MFRVLACVFTQHNLWLVALAAVICVLSIAGSVAVLDRLDSAARNRQRRWLFLAGLAAGGGTWATHFVAMVAYDPGQAIGYQPFLTLLSALVGILGAWGALEVFNRFRDAEGRIASGIILGTSVAGLHYVGMASVEMGARPVWAGDLVIASCLLSAAAAVAGMYTLAITQGIRGKALAVAFLVLGVVSLHFTGMGAVIFVPDPTFIAPHADIDRTGIAILVAVLALCVLVVACGIALADRRLVDANAASAARMQRLADAAFEGIVLHDGKFVLDANRQFALFVGAKPEEIIGKRLRDYTRNDLQPDVTQEMRTRGVYEFETVLISPHGETPVEVHSRLLSDGVYVSAVRDISVRQRAESAERENIAKSQFIANMSHELRTPLNAIIGYSEMIEEDSEDARTREDAKHIRNSARHLLNLINDILDLSRTEAGRVEIMNEECDLGDLVREACATLQPTATANGDMLSCEIDLGITSVIVDGMRFKQCLLNLLSNAVKFTANGEVRVRAVRSGSFIDVAVSDTGIGMNEAQMARVFDAFVQADGTIARRYGGTGLGLAITRRLARLMGGDVMLQSQEGVGSTFTLRIPVNANSVATAVAA